MILKCKMCGGSINVKEGETFGVCDSCGILTDLFAEKHSQENLQKESSRDNEEALLVKANNYLRIGQFKDARDFFNKVFEFNPQNPHAHWGKLLCELNVKSDEELIKSPQVLDKCLGNLRFFPKSGVTYEEYLGSEMFEKYVVNKEPTLGAFIQYQSAVRFADPELKLKYININNQLVKCRKDLYKRNLDARRVVEESRENLLKETESSSYSKWWLKIFGLTLGVISVIYIIFYVATILFHN